MLLNIDFPLKKATLHPDGCIHVPKPMGTQYKPVGELGRDGGWFQVESETQGKAVAGATAPRAEVILCRYC